MKLIATYAEGFMACFTESRTGMKQRALIDVGDKAPTPQELAELAGILCDQWGWENRIERSPAQVRKKELPSTRPQPRGLRDNSDLKPAEREPLILKYLAQHPNSNSRAIVEGLGFGSDAKRLARWAFTLATMDKMGTIISKKMHDGQVNRLLYSLPEGKP